MKKKEIIYLAPEEVDEKFNLLMRELRYVPSERELERRYGEDIIFTIYCRKYKQNITNYREFLKNKSLIGNPTYKHQIKLWSMILYEEGHSIKHIVKKLGEKRETIEKSLIDYVDRKREIMEGKYQQISKETKDITIFKLKTSKDSLEKIGMLIGLEPHKVKYIQDQAIGKGVLDPKYKRYLKSKNQTIENLMRTYVGT